VLTRFFLIYRFGDFDNNLLKLFVHFPCFLLRRDLFKPHMIRLDSVIKSQYQERVVSSPRRIKDCPIYLCQKTEPELTWLRHAGVKVNVTSLAKVESQQHAAHAN
jgi:hypothetical protein